MTTREDAAMVADRLGLPADAAEHCRRALDDVAMLGLQGFVDQTLQDASTAYLASRTGQRPDPDTILRMIVRQRIIEGVTGMLDERRELVDYDGPVH